MEDILLINVITEYKKLLKITGKTRQFLLLLLLRAPFEICFTVINALFLQHAFNAIQRNDSGSLINTCIIFGIACFCLFLYNGTIWCIYAPFSTRLEWKLRTELYKKILSFSYERIESISHGEWLTRLNTDVEMPFSQSVHLPHAACSILCICISSIILWFINPVIFGWVMLFILPNIIINQLFIARVMTRLNKKSLEAIAVNTGELASLITCSDIIKIYDSQDYLLKRFEESSLRLFKAKMRIVKRNSFGDAVLPLFALSGFLVLLIISGDWITSGSLTFGDLTAAFQFRGGILKSSNMFINCMISIQGSMAGIKRINDIMEEKTEK